MNAETKKASVRERYGEIAQESASCCCGGTDTESISSRLGYTNDKMNAVPEGANLGLGCGNPIAGAIARDRYLGLMRDAGFDSIEVLSETPFTDELLVKNGDEEVIVPEGVVMSVSVSAVRS